MKKKYLAKQLIPRQIIIREFVLKHVCARACVTVSVIKDDRSNFSLWQSSGGM